jgi:hypothetical protein
MNEVEFSSDVSISLQRVLLQANKDRNRVKIVYDDLSTVFCRVGKSTGHKPCLLEIKTSRSLGGSQLLTSGIKLIKGGKNYATILWSKHSYLQGIAQ